MAVVALTATIANGASLSDIVELPDATVAAIVTPAALTGTTLTFQASSDKVTFTNVYDDAGTEVSITVSTSRTILLSNVARFLGVKFLKVRSGTAGTPTTESGADRAIQILAVK